MNITQHTLQSKLRKDASAMLSVVGQKAMKHKVAGIRSLCVLAIASSTLVTYSQETGKPSTTPATVAKVTGAKNLPTPTLPITRTITDTKGRRMDGAILAKTEKGISFERASDKTKFEVKLDTLSADDLVWLEGVRNKTGPTVLYLTDKWEEDSERIQWLRDHKFDVTVAFTHVLERSDGRGQEQARNTPYEKSRVKTGIPDDVPAIRIEDPKDLDGYDIFWNGRAVDNWNWFDETEGPKTCAAKLRDHRNKNLRIVVVTGGSNWKKRHVLSTKLRYDMPPSACKSLPNFVNVDENFLIYRDKEDTENTRKKIAEELLKMVERY